jgi:hypothetical protein
MAARGVFAIVSFAERCRLAAVEKRRVFISHIHEEGEIAIALKKLIESAFLGMVDAFVSSSPKSIKAGRKWLSEVTDALKECSVEVILASPEAVTRPWINFEAGCGWIRDIPVIPLCHSGMTKNKLPVPLNELQAVSAISPEDIHMVFATIAEAIPCDLPDFDPSEFIAVVEGFESTTAESKAMDAASPVASKGGLRPREIATLAELAGMLEGSSHDTIALSRLRQQVNAAGFNDLAVSLAIRMLLRMQFIETVQEQDGWEYYRAVRMTESGWEWLETHQDLLDFGPSPPPNQITSGEIPDDEVPF